MDRGRVIGGLAALLLGVFAGCGQDVGRMDADEMRDPLMRRAAAKTAEGDIDYAIDLYRKTLDIAPRTARASLNMAILLQDEKADYIGAIYHYRRYLDLRPDTDKRDLIENRIRLASQAYAGTVARGSREEAALAREKAELEAVNENLLGRIETLQDELAEARRKQREIRAGMESQRNELIAREARAPDPAGSRTQHRVQRGDTLTNIAEQYGLRVGALVEANDLGNANMIFVGQVLTIPKGEE